MCKNTSGWKEYSNVNITIFGFKGNPVLRYPAIDNRVKPYTPFG